MRHLWPPIEVIAGKLAGAGSAAPHFPDDEKTMPAENGETGNAEMPEFIRSRIRQRLASRAAQFCNQPAMGKILLFDGNPRHVASLCVLLDQALDENRWQGWLVAAETDYATDLDVLLEPHDEPFDPVAVMVQTWNPVRVRICKDMMVLAQLAEHRLAAIREVAAGKLEPGGGARPGFIAPLWTHGGACVLCGTRIHHPHDPRRRYQSLYRAMAQSLDASDGR